MKKLIVIFTVFVTFLGVTLGKTIYVNANYPTDGNGTSWSSPYTNLQTAVTAAFAGDLVLVTNGVYSPISTGNKAITIQSVNGYADTIIDGNKTARCITGSSGIYTTIIDGFTLVNGGSTNYLGSGGGALGGTVANSLITNCNTRVDYYGGGTYNAYLIGSTVTGCWARDGGGVSRGKATNCVIRGNSCRYNGGGVSVATLIDCDIYENYAPSGGGGVYQGTATMCTVVSNSASSGGGTHSATIYDSTISGNTANTYGGGSYGGTLTGCTISGNTANGYGGGTSGGTLTGCTISGNTANGYGGGTSSSTLTDCTISGNTANQRGGGALGGTLTGCTISGNTALINGGGCYNGTIMSCLVVGNIAPVGSQIRNQDINFYAYNSTIIGECSFPNTTRDIVNNIFSGANITFPASAQVGFNTFSGTLTGGTIVGPNLTATNPQFVDAANTNFTLLATSPCINKGANQYVTTPTDLAGSPRIKDWRVDMGAYESQSTRFVRTPNALFPMGTKDVYRWTPLELRPIAWYKGDDNATDSAGEYDGTWAGTEAYADGITGISFYNASTNYILIPHATTFNSTDRSISVWVKSSTSGDRCILSKGSAAGFHFRLRGSGNVDYSWNRSYNVLTASLAPLTSGNWHHVVIVQSGTNATIYIDGVFIKTGTSGNLPISTSNDPIYIFARWNFTQFSERFVGQIDDVLIFDRALSPTEVKKLYDETVKQNGEPW